MNSALSLTRTDFNFPGQKQVYKGKVRDVYTMEDGRLIMVVSDRISAFDHVLPKGIPYKGQVLNQLAARNLRATDHIVPNWLDATPDPNVSVGRRAEPYRVEMVIRGYLAGHSWREYKAGKRMICGVEMPEGMQENDPFPTPIITPATKAEEGHDEDISREAIMERGIVVESDYLKLESYTQKLFDFGSKLARERGLILVDTKYEFGKSADGEIVLIDEAHTPDSSRYFYADGYQERQDRGERQKQLSKEFVREWWMANGFQGLEGQTMPVMPEAFVQEVTDRYVELFERLSGEKFIFTDITNMEERVYNNVMNYLND